MVQKIFTEVEAQAIVDTLIRGNNSYLQERVNKRNEMTVSGGYAWTRPNHLDDAFAKANLPFIKDYSLKKAGESWQYLEFQASNNSRKTMLIIKNRTRLSATYEKKGQAETSQYLVDCAAINKNIAGKDKPSTEPEKIQLELFDDFPNFNDVSVKEHFKDFEAFYAIVYEVDQIKHINKVEIVMPNPFTQLLDRVQDLTNFLSESEISQFSSDILQDFPEEAPMLSEEYGYVAREEEEENAQ